MEDALKAHDEGRLRRSGRKPLAWDNPLVRNVAELRPLSKTEGPRVYHIDIYATGRSTQRQLMLPRRVWLRLWRRALRRSSAADRQRPARREGAVEAARGGGRTRDHRSPGRLSWSLVPRPEAVGPA